MYSSSAIRKLIDRYYDKGGNQVTLKEGSLGFGTLILYGEGLKTCIVNEVYLNEWNSGHKIRFYNTMPKKYVKMLEKLGV